MCEAVEGLKELTLLLLQQQLTLVFSDGSTSGIPSRYLTRSVLCNLHARRSGEYPSDP